MTPIITIDYFSETEEEPISSVYCEEYRFSDTRIVQTAINFSLKKIRAKYGEIPKGSFKLKRTTREQIRE